MTLGEKIKGLRERLQWTQQDLAVRSHCTQKAITKIENDHSRKPRFLPDIAGALGITVEELLSGIEKVGVSEPRADAAKKTRKARSRWPFKFDYDIYDQLLDPEKLEIESFLFSKINEIEARNAAPVKRGKDRAVGRGKKSLRVEAA